MPETSWTPVLAALDRARTAGRILDVWLRDDDAVTVTPSLERLTTLCGAVGMPVLLAVIPAPADHGLAGFVARHAHLTPTQHGFCHANHAAPGERARELGGLQDRSAVLAELREGRARLSGLFGDRAADILVPPWNRIDDDLLPAIPGLGFAALSTFGPPVDGPLPRLNCDFDPIDWRNGRRCRPHDVLIARLAELIADRVDGTLRPIGLLTHHFVHDDAAWAFCETALQRLGSHPAVRFASAQALLARGPS